MTKLCICGPSLHPLFDYAREEIDASYDHLGGKDTSVFPFCALFVTDFSWTANVYGTNEFGIPDVPDELCLLLCPYMNLLIFTDQAFAAPELTSPEQLFRLRIPPGQK